MTLPVVAKLVDGKQGKGNDQYPLCMRYINCDTSVASVRLVYDEKYRMHWHSLIWYTVKQKDHIFTASKLAVPYNVITDGR